MAVNVNHAKYNKPLVKDFLIPDDSSQVQI